MECVVCEAYLDEPFPEDYPEEFKFCCSCLAWATAIIKTPTDEWVKLALRESPTIMRIHKKITIFDGKKKGKVGK